MEQTFLRCEKSSTEMDGWMDRWVAVVYSTSERVLCTPFAAQNHNPPASKARREVANLIERKNLHTPIYGVKEFVHLSVINFDPNYLRTGRTECSQKILFVGKVAIRARAEGQKQQHFDPIS